MPLDGSISDVVTTRLDGIQGGHRRSFTVGDEPRSNDTNGSSLPPNTPAPIRDVYSTNQGGDDRLRLGGFDLGSYPSDPNSLREELRKSFAGVDAEGLRKMEEEARKRRQLLQQSMRMNRGDPVLAARSNGPVSDPELLDPPDKQSNPIIITA